ncbi:MAG: hypothetical protein JF602_09565 [Gemmatimonadetes bacterium]|nr:hypothetical protein [Gemmatimonadota bacterium]
MAEQSGAWVGGGAGRTWDGFSGRKILAGEVGAWMKAAGATVVASTAPTSVDDSLRYADSQLSAHWSQSSVEVGAEIGVRSGATGAIIGGFGRHWGSVAVTTWLAPRVGLILSGWTYPIDLTQGFPGGRFLTLSMRLRSSPTDTREFNPGGIGKASSELGITFKARHPSKGLVALEISAVGAKTVEVSGDFTAWKPVRLTPSPDGVWRI